jgi:hypothetical protein
LQARFPIVDFALAAFDFGEAIFRSRFVRNKLIDIPIKLRLALIQFAMPGFDGRFPGD